MNNSGAFRQWIYDSFANWQTIMELQAAENRQILTDIALTAQRAELDATIAELSALRDACL